MQIRTALSGAIAFGLLASASAQAALTSPPVMPTNSSLFVTVFDSTTNESFVTNLGLFYSTFVQNDSTVAIPATIRDGAFTPRSFDLNMGIFADNDAANLRFNVYAGDSLGGNTAKGIIMTGVAAPVLNHSNMNAVNTRAAALITTTNTNCGDTIGCAGNFGDEFLWGSSIGGNFPVGSAAGFDQALGFYLVVGTGNTSTSLAATTPFADASGVWNWMLSEGGLLTFSPTAGTPIPLPAAAWLLISGLVGVGALGRRSSPKA
jgi:hypothetical protein